MLDSDASEASVVFFGNEFPNDDLKDLFRRLLQRSKDRRFRILASFLEEASLVLKQEIADLPYLARDELPHFDNLLTLAEHGDFRDGSLGAAMESAFLVVLQLGMLIGHYEAHDLEMDIVKRGATLAGLSIGLFSGAAVALANSLSDLIKTGPQALKISWRLGVYVQNFSRSLEAPQPDGALQSWAHVVTGMTKAAVQEEITRYNNESANPDLVKVFISAADKNSVGVTGPPSRLKAAFQHSTALRYSKSLPLPVYDGVCHAPHIYQQDDIVAICKTDGDVVRTVQAALLSSQTGKPFTAQSSNELYLQICTELLTGTIYMDNITAGLLEHISTISSLKNCHVQTFRTSLILKGMLQAFETEFPQAKTSKVDMISWAFEDFVRRSGSYADAKLAIVGMSCRMPGGGNDHEEWWKLLDAGYDAHTTVPIDRFDLETHYDPTGQTENATQTPFGNFIDRPGFFDAGFFSMTPKEAEQTDPMHRLALVTAYEAMEMAGFVSGRTASSRSSRVGTWYGQASDDWRELNASQNIGTYAVPGGVRAFATGRLNYFFKFSGPSYDIDTACSSSAAAVQQACSALWAGEVDTAIAGGLNVITDPDNYAGLCNAFFLSKTGQCKVWDKDADGYCRAEGIGSVVIKRLEDAEADNDNILAVVLSGATNHSADAISITHPHAGAQEANYRQVLHKAGVNPMDVSFIEMHGTGTQAGDAIESESVLNVFAPTTQGRRKDQLLRLGAVKSNIGHGEAAAGISSIIKTLLCFQKEKIPMHVGIKTEINPTIPKDLARRNVALATAETPWQRQPGKLRTALVNSFGASGGNTTLLLEDGPERPKSQAPTRTTHAITVSAKSKKSLQANLKALVEYLKQHPDTDLADLSYTTCARRSHHNLRLGTTVSSTTSLLKYLNSVLDQKHYAEVRPVPAKLPSIVFTFTGQGTSFRGSQELFADSPIFRKEIVQLDQLVQRLGFQSIIPIVEGVAGDDLISSPVSSQLSIVVLEIALARFWASFGIKPDAVIGHSLGEYAALAVAGVLSIVDVLYLVGRRAQLTEARCTPNSHVMLSIRASMSEIREILESSPATAQVNYELACQNTNQDTVLGGLRASIDAIRETLEARSIKALALEMPFAFHTAQMDAIIDDLEAMASRLTFKAPSIPVLSSFLGTAVFDGKTFGAQYLRNQTRGTVNFVGAIEAAQDLGIADERTVWVDLGPQPVCTTLVRSIIPKAVTAASCKRNEDNIATISKSLLALHLAGLQVAWNEYFRPYEHSFTLLDLPRYKWNETNYWIPYYGTWALDKALYKHGLDKKALAGPVPIQSSLKTSLVHQVLKESLEGSNVSIVAMSDIQHPDFLEAVHGHQMNNCGVATSSIWSDIALTIGEHAYKLARPQVKEIHMNLREFEVLHAQVANTNKRVPQLLQVEASLDLDTSSMSIAWYDVDATTDTRATDHFASGTVRFEDPKTWRTEWDRVSHLVSSRIEALEQMAAAGKASKLSKNMAYTLFKNVVDYADKYRGMDTVILNDYEAVADVTLTKDRHGTWHTPPHWIDSVCHLAGLIMNGSDSSNTKDFFYVTPGSDSLRFIKPLEAGGKYRSYVRMFPLPVEAGNIHAGDVYVLQDDVIVAVLTQIRFRRVPRTLMDRFFAPPNTKASHGSAPKAAAPASHASGPVRQIAAAKTEPSAAPVKAAASVAVAAAKGLHKDHLAAIAVGPKPMLTPPDSDSGSSSFEIVEVPVDEKKPAVAVVVVAAEPNNGLSDTASRCLQLIARETSLAMSDLTPDAGFSSLGVDSLMSLVLAEKLKAELGFEVKSSLFLECPTIGEMTAWLDQYS